MRLLMVPDSEIIEAIGFSDPMVVSDGVFGTLGVVFKSSPNDVYLYKGVSSTTVAELMCGESIGKVFHEKFKKTKYPFTKSARATLQK